MKKFFRLLLKWTARILLGFLAFMLVGYLLFTVFRGRIVRKAVDIINHKQNGEVYLESINLRPFLHFPDVSLKLNSLNYRLPVAVEDSMEYQTLLNLEELYVELDIVQLIKGNYKISRINIGEGEVHYHVGADSVSNVEKALGISFDNDTTRETPPQDTSLLAFDLELLQIRNLFIYVDDIPGKTRASFKINGMQSGISYKPDTVMASLMMHMSIPDIIYDEIMLDKPREVSFSTSLTYDQHLETIEISKTMLDIQDALFEVDGTADLKKKLVDMKFSARNTGIDLLNFLLSGILNVDEIEQFGNGSITLDGDIAGSFENESLPLMNAEFTVMDMGFIIHSIDQRVSGIQFSGTATNGSKPDFSEASFTLNDFHADFPEGKLDMNIELSNLIQPVAFVEIEGNGDLAVLGEIIENESIKDLQGTFAISGTIDGKIEQDTDQPLTSSGKLDIDLANVNLNYEDHHIADLNGKISIEGQNAGIEGFSLNLDGSDMTLESKIENILPFIMDYNANPSIYIYARSNKLDLNKILNDTITDGAIEDLDFKLNAHVKEKELRKFIEDGTIPEIQLDIRDLSLVYPGILPLNSLNLQLATVGSNLQISEFGGRIGESDFHLSGALDNYPAFIESDSSESVTIDFLMKSETLRAKDVFTMNDEFTTLPDEFISEEIHDLFLKGKIETTVADILSGNTLPNFNLQVKDLSWKLKQYPHHFEYFYADIENRDSLLLVNNFSGYIGESNVALLAQFVNLFDTTGILSGNLQIQSDLLDVDALMDYELLTSSSDIDTAAIDSLAPQDAGLHDIDMPDLTFMLDIGELRFEGNNFYEIGGQIRLKPYQIIYFDQLALQTKTGGSVMLDGQFNVMDSSMYNFTASLAIDTLNMSDFNVELVLEDSIYSLEDNFNGVMTADGIAEFFVYPDLSINLDTSTAIFNVKLENGRVKNFAPLHAIARYTGKSDLDNVQFGELRNSFTLADGMVNVPLMSISSTLGLILLEGEQRLNGEMLYLARVPTKLIRGTAWNMLSNQQNKKPEEEEEIQRMASQQFAKITIYGKGDILEVKIGDKRDKYR